MKARIGDRIDGFRVEKILSESRFACVYKAEHPNLPGSVVLKGPIDGLSERELKFFQVEAEHLRKLEHPNIVRVLDFRRTASGPFIVMEYLEGMDLRQVIKQEQQKERQITLRDKISILVQVAEALAYIHNHFEGKVVHGDIKPENIMVMPDKAAKLMDFAFSRADFDVSSRQVKLEERYCTPQYLAPEQLADAKDAWGRPPADVFAYGVVAYEFLAGVHPFQAQREEIMLRNIRYNDPAPLDTRLPDCPLPLEQEIHACLNKAAQNRPRDLSRTAAALIVTRAQLDRAEARARIQWGKEQLQKGNVEGARSAMQEVARLDAGSDEASELLSAIANSESVARIRILRNEAQSSLQQGERLRALELAGEAEALIRKNSALGLSEELCNWIPDVRAACGEIDAQRENVRNLRKRVNEFRKKGAVGEANNALWEIVDVGSTQSIDLADWQWAAQEVVRDQIQEVKRLMEQGNYPAAKAILNRIDPVAVRARLDESLAIIRDDIRYALINEYLSSDSEDHRQATLTTLIGKYGNDPQAQRLKARDDLEKGRVQEALECARRFPDDDEMRRIADDATDISRVLDEADNLARTNNYIVARYRVEQRTGWKRNRALTEKLEELGRLSIKALDLVKRQARELMARDPATAEEKLRYAQSRIGWDAEAEALLKEAVSRKNSEIPPESAADLANRVHRLLSQGKQALAKQLHDRFGEPYRDDPAYRDAYRRLDKLIRRSEVAALINEGKTDEARQKALRLVRDYPEEREVLASVPKG
jgi:serine/threonine protein kinase